MSYAQVPAVTRAGAPGATDDSSKGFVIGSMWINTSAAPREVYVCTNASTGAAVWALAQGVTQHSALTGLGWSGSGHTGTQNSVACFDGAGASQTVQATAEGSVLTYTGGILTFAVYAMAVSYLSDRTYEVNYVTTLDAAPDAFVQAGSLI